MTGIPSEAMKPKMRGTGRKHASIKPRATRSCDQDRREGSADRQLRTAGQDLAALGWCFATIGHGYPVRSSVYQFAAWAR